ncbi:MAG: hypothetical protein HZC54_07615 [Verrucomicrobia bacterium]|nr:hypothetical protein [Verrucomicrobiota bacterium]
MLLTHHALRAIPALALAATAQAAPLLYDMGTEKSEVWSGFTQVTPKSDGWQSKDGLTASARAYREMVEDKRRGRMEQPPIWTNPITEDAVIGETANAYLISAPPGDYNLHIVCGTSDSKYRAQFFDFTVQVGKQTQRMQIEG